MHAKTAISSTYSRSSKYSTRPEEISRCMPPRDLSLAILITKNRKSMANCDACGQWRSYMRATALFSHPKNKSKSGEHPELFFISILGKTIYFSFVCLSLQSQCKETLFLKCVKLYSLFLFTIFKRPI